MQRLNRGVSAQVKVPSKCRSSATRHLPTFSPPASSQFTRRYCSRHTYPSPPNSTKIQAANARTVSAEGALCCQPPRWGAWERRILVQENGCKIGTFLDSSSEQAEKTSKKQLKFLLITGGARCKTAATEPENGLKASKVQNRCERVEKSQKTEKSLRNQTKAKQKNKPT